MRRLSRHIIHLFALLLLGLCISCSERHRPDRDGAICVKPSLAGDYKDTKAYIFEGTALPSANDDEDFFFTVDAYLGQDLFFTSNVKHLYIYNDQDQVDEWRFHDGTGWKDYYYPQKGYYIDMFGYIPRGYVTVTQANPPIFTVEMPNDGQTNLEEFMYAYAPEQSADNAGPVELVFQHPFTAIRFVVKQSHRNLTINSIGFQNLKCTGTCIISEDKTATWTLKDPKTMTIPIDKTIPKDINFGGPIGDTYLVIPQKFTDGLALYLDYNWDNNDGNDQNDHYAPSILLSEIHTAKSWEAGYIYTYAMNLGNSAEEIRFDVTVVRWDETYTYEFELE